MSVTDQMCLFHSRSCSPEGFANNPLDRLNAVAKRKAARDVSVLVSDMCCCILIAPSHLPLLGHACQFEVSMVGRCSKGPRRRKAPTNTEITDVTSRDSNSDSTVLNLVRGSSQEESNRPLPASVFSSTGSNGAQLDLDLSEILNWNPSSAPDPAESRSTGNSNVLFADPVVSPTDEFRYAISQLDIPLPTDKHTSRLETGQDMGFVPSSTMNPVSTALPPTPDEIAVGPGIACTSDSLQHQTSSLLGSVDSKPEICTLFHIMSNLEAELGNSGSSIDRIMHTVKASTKEIQQVIQSTQWHLVVIGPMLALVAIEVALILIESIVSSWGGGFAKAQALIFPLEIRKI